MNIIDILKAVFFGILEGFTEWLPISSTGHLIILEGVLKIKESYGSEFWSLFLVVIQLGAIMAVVSLFFSDLSPIKKSKREKIEIYRLWLKIGIAIIPSIIFGLLFNDYLESRLYNAVVVSTALIFYGIVFIVIEKINKNRVFKDISVGDISYFHAFLIGLFQVLALIPGTSRSGITIIGAMLLLYNRSCASRFSFYLSIPTMLGASMLKALKFFVDDHTLTMLEIYFILIGSLCAFIVSLIVVRLLLSYIKKHNFTVFGYYRIALGIIILILYLNNII